MADGKAEGFERVQPKGGRNYKILDLHRGSKEDGRKLWPPQSLDDGLGWAWERMAARGDLALSWETKIGAHRPKRAVCASKGAKQIKEEDKRHGAKVERGGEVRKELS